MYGLPRGIDLSFFQQKSLLQVCFGLHDLILNFDDVSVTVTSSIGISDSATTQNCENFLQAAGPLTALLERRVTSASGDTAGTLKLDFDNDKSLFIYDDSRKYESYTIRYADKLIVV
jgi:hypothetical protein